MVPTPRDIYHGNKLVFHPWSMHANDVAISMVPSNQQVGSYPWTVFLLYACNAKIKKYKHQAKPLKG